MHFLYCFEIDSFYFTSVYIIVLMRLVYRNMFVLYLKKCIYLVWCWCWCWYCSNQNQGHWQNKIISLKKHALCPHSHHFSPTLPVWRRDDIWFLCGILQFDFMKKTYTVDFWSWMYKNKLLYLKFCLLSIHCFSVTFLLNKLSCNEGFTKLHECITLVNMQIVKIRLWNAWQHNLWTEVL